MPGDNRLSTTDPNVVDFQRSCLSDSNVNRDRCSRRRSSARGDIGTCCRKVFEKGGVDLIIEFPTGCGLHGQPWCTTFLVNLGTVDKKMADELVSLVQLRGLQIDEPKCHTIVVLPQHPGIHS